MRSEMVRIYGYARGREHWQSHSALQHQRKKEIDDSGLAAMRIALSDGTEDKFDDVVTADGMHSKMCTLIFGQDASKLAYQPLVSCWAVWSMSFKEGDVPNDEVQLSDVRAPAFFSGRWTPTAPVCIC
eukprot:Colp12_sorted_trinity150504_noHs@27292